MDSSSFSSVTSQDSPLASPPAGGPVLRLLELVEGEYTELARNHPRERMQRMGDPFFVGHNRDALESRMVLQ